MDALHIETCVIFVEFQMVTIRRATFTCDIYAYRAKLFRGHITFEMGQTQ